MTQIEIITKNIETLDRLRKQIPEFDAHLTGVKVDHNLISNLRLYDFENIYIWLKDKTQDEIFLKNINPVTWKELKPLLLKNTHVDNIKAMTGKSEKQFHHMLTSRMSLRKYRYLWRNSEIVKAIQGYLMNNPLIKYDNSYINVFIKYYTNILVPSYYIYTQKEINATDDLINTVVNSIDYDGIARINVNQFTNKISEAIKDKIRSIIKRGSKLKCKDVPGDGFLVVGKIYEVNDTYISGDGFLYVNVKNENNQNVQYMYTVFEELSKERESQLFDLLN